MDDIHWRKCFKNRRKKPGGKDYYVKIWEKWIQAFFFFQILFWLHATSDLPQYRHGPRLALSRFPLSTDTSGICGKRWHEPIGGIPNSGPTLKIYGGNAAHPREYPWQARLLEIDHRFGTELHLGGATIISEFWLLTAAHCVEK